MSFTPQAGDVPVSLSVLGGLVTNQPAATLPEGVSPDNQDGAFLPGAFFSRAALQKVFATGKFPAGGPSGYVPTITYAKSFVTPLGGIENLYLDSNGNLYWEDVINSPGNLTNIASTVAPGSWAKSITAFGREYIAFSDGLHGTDVPVQWDGTNVDRVTQDGPGAPPNIACIVLPSVGLVASGSIVLTLTESDPAGLTGGNFTSINCFTSTSTAGVNPGDAITIAGYGGASAPMNGQWTVTAVYVGLVQVSALLPNTTAFSVAAATGTVLTGTMVRQGNIVTVSTATAHQLQVGYQAQIAKIPAQAVGSGIASISISNEDNPGLATIGTNAAHGLLPGLFVSITGVNATAIGSGLASLSRNGQIVTAVTNAAHGLSPGALITLAGNTPTSFNTTVPVLNVMSATSFTFFQADVDATASAAGTVSLNWPIPTTATPTYFEVIACPTTTSFQVAITYSDGSWSSGAVTYAWNGTFFVTAVPSTTSFQYQQYGPNASTNSTAGTVTPVGQIAPGLHQCQVIFQTRAGQLTRPSPPVKFTANGGEYVSVTNLPIGPGNVIARILAFTGASGSSFFYIPATPQANGQIVGTSTEVNDNTTLAVVLDFSDPTLFGAAAINIPGNNLPAQIILDGALGFGLYGSRLITWGQRNRIQNFLAMGFEGGQFYNATGGGASSFPCGWTAGAGGAGGSLVGGHWGLGWQASGAGSIYQSAFEDAYGVPILTPNTTYTLRAWIRGNGTSLTATLASATSGFSATATVNGSVTGVGSFQEHAFSTVMPSPIPADMLLTLTWTGTPLIDELSIIYQANPYTDTVMYCSYGDNPEAFDGLTGKLGSTQDQHKVMEMSEIRRAGYFLTQDPGGRLHEFVDNGVTEPAGWTVDEVAANCGLLSAWGLSKSQADDSSASGGEEWFAWMSSVGARIFGGGEPQEISREIYPDWIGATAAQASQWSNATGINPAFQKFCWCLNDPVSRTILFGLTLNGNPQGSANRVYTLNYVGLNTASEIANTGPVRIGFSGKRIATDHARKWTKWNGAVTLNGAALMYRGAGKTQPIFFGGNGTVPGTIPGTGNVYLLNPSRYTDDDYGQMAPYYIAGPIPGEETEQSTGLAGFRKLLAYVTTFIYSPVVCSLSIVPYVDNLANAWKLTVTRPLQTNPSRDLEFGGCSAQGNRIFLKFAALPSSGTDCGISIQRLTAWVRKQKHFPVAGA